MVLVSLYKSCFSVRLENSSALTSQLNSFYVIIIRLSKFMYYYALSSLYFDSLLAKDALARQPQKNSWTNIYIASNSNMFSLFLGFETLIIYIYVYID